MTPTIRENYTFGFPRKGFLREMLNSDAEDYGGSGVGNPGGAYILSKKHKEWDYSVKVTLPPLAVSIYKLEEEIESEIEAGAALDEPMNIEVTSEKEIDLIYKTEH